MPWTGEQFKERHAKHLSGAAASKAAEMANAMLREGTDEGTAIATAIKHANSTSGRAERRYGKRG